VAEKVHQRITLESISFIIKDSLREFS